MAVDGPPAALVIVEVRWRAGRDFGCPRNLRLRPLQRVRSAPRPTVYSNAALLPCACRSSWPRRGRAGGGAGPGIIVTRCDVAQRDHSASAAARGAGVVRLRAARSSHDPGLVETNVAIFSINLVAGGISCHQQHGHTRPAAWITSDGRLVETRLENGDQVRLLSVDRVGHGSAVASCIRATSMTPTARGRQRGWSPRQVSAALHEIDEQPSPGRRRPCPRRYQSGNGLHGLVSLAHALRRDQCHAPLGRRHECMETRVETPSHVRRGSRTPAFERPWNSLGKPIQVLAALVISTASYPLRHGPQLASSPARATDPHGRARLKSVGVQLTALPDRAEPSGSRRSRRATSCS